MATYRYYETAWGVLAAIVDLNSPCNKWTDNKNYALLSILEYMAAGDRLYVAEYAGGSFCFRNGKVLDLHPFECIRDITQAWHVMRHKGKYSLRMVDPHSFSTVW